jgi:hypothetical protein
MCNECYEEHPFGTPCYGWVAPKEDTSLIDASIAAEEAFKEVEDRRVLKLKKLYESERKQKWRDANRVKYNEYMKDYMAKNRPKAEK